MPWLNVSSLNRKARAIQAGEPFIAGCTGKKGYRSWDKTVAAVAASGPGFSSYKCHHCHKYHLTHVGRVGQS